MGQPSIVFIPVPSPSARWPVVPQSYNLELENFLHGTFEPDKKGRGYLEKGLGGPPPPRPDELPLAPGELPAITGQSLMRLRGTGCYRGASRDVVKADTGGW